MPITWSVVAVDDRHDSVMVSVDRDGVCERMGVHVPPSLSSDEEIKAHINAAVLAIEAKPARVELARLMEMAPVDAAALAADLEAAKE